MQLKEVILWKLKRQSHVPAQYKLCNNIIIKLISYDLKIVLSNEMLFLMITATHESLAHASALKCYLSLQEDFTINNAVSYTHLDVYKRQV